MTLTALFFVLFYTAGLGRALAGKPIWGLYIYFFSFYFHAPTQWWGAALPELRWSLMAAIVTLIALFLNPPKEGFRFWTFRENRWLSLFAVFVSIQMAWALEGNLHSEYMFLFFKFLLLIFLIQNTVLTLKDLKGVFWVNILCGCYLAYLGMSMHSGGRLEGIGTPGMESANQLGQHFSVLIFLGGYFLLEKFKIHHVIFGFALSMILMAMFLTESRGVIIAVVATGSLAFFFAPKGSKKKIGVFSICAIIAGAALMGPQIIERFQTTGTDEDGVIEDGSARSRVVIIDAQLEMWKKNPLFGYGHAGTYMLSLEYVPEAYRTQDGAGRRASHNVTMSFLVDHGAIGTSLYFIAIFTCLWRIWAVRKVPSTIKAEDIEEYRVTSNLLVGAVFALLCYMLGGQFSSNKVLEADIWLLALIPVLHRRLENMSGKNIPTKKDEGLFNVEE